MPRMLKPRTSLDQMLSAFLVLLACELAGDLLRQVLALPVPGPVIGMTILVAALIFKRKAPTFHSPVIVSLEQTSEALIRHMGLLFVPAGVGLIAKMQVLRSEWIAAGLIGSTLLSLAVTGLVMHWSIRRRAARRPPDTVQHLERGLAGPPPVGQSIISGIRLAQLHCYRSRSRWPPTRLATCCSGSAAARPSSVRC